MTHGEGTSRKAGSSKEHQRRLTMSLVLTSTVFIAEVISAALTGSLALLVDAGHMLTDLSVLVASAVTAMPSSLNCRRTCAFITGLRSQDGHGVQLAADPHDPAALGPLVREFHRLDDLGMGQ